MITRLAIQRFRRLDAVRLELPPGPSLFVGPNAQGKTSILEAVHYLSLGRSFRTHTDRDVIPHAAPGTAPRHDAPPTTIDGLARHATTRRHLRVAFAGRTKAVSLDDKPLRTLSDLWGVLRSVCLVPADSELVTGAPAARRGLLDHLAGQLAPGYLKTLADYHRALQNRNSLLRRRTPPGDAQYAAFEAAMATAAARVGRERRRFADLLAATAAPFLGQLTGDGERLGVAYAPGFSHASPLAGAAWLDAEAGALEHQLAAWWQHARSGDLERGTTRDGPHRDDLALRINDAEARSFSSTGQMRGIVAALRLAEARLLTTRDQAPVLLLDDVLGELDARRGAALLGLVAGLGIQALITATDASGVERHLDVAARFAVRDGCVVAG